MAIRFSPWPDTEQLAQAFFALVPPARLVPAPMPTFDWRPSVLVVGRKLADDDCRFIAQSGVVAHVPTIAGGLVRLGEARWDAIVVAPGISDDADGLRFVRALKTEQRLVGGGESLARLRESYAETPFVVRPLPGDTQYAVFYSAMRWFLGDTETVPLAEAVVRSIGGSPRRDA